MRAATAIWIASAALCLVPITGCWDRVEIENVGIILGIGFDKLDKQTDHSDSKGHMISMTHHFAVPEQFAAKEGATTKKTYVNLTSEGEQVFENINGLSTRLSRTPSYEHLRVIVINEDVAKTMDLKNIVNFLLRNSETRRSIRMLIAKGPTIKLFEKEGISTNPALKLREMTEGYRETLRMLPDMKLGDFSEHLTGKHSFVIQSVTTSAKESQIAGAAVIKGETGKMTGWLNEEETTGLSFLLPSHKRSGVIKGVDPKSGTTIIYEVQNINRTIRPKIQGDRIDFAVELNTDGRLREDWAYPGNAYDEEFVKRAELAAQLSIKKFIEEGLSKTQKTFKADVAGFGKKLQIHDPKVWKKVKDHWDDTFSKSEIDVKVTVKILEFGTRATKKG